MKSHSQESVFQEIRKIASFYLYIFYILFYVCDKV
jgi:hypothetical protein